MVTIKVENKIATNLTPEEFWVNGNSDYQVRFEFDEIWEEHTIKTALFVFGAWSIPVPFEGNTCDVPKLFDTNICEVGVFAGDLITTTPALVKCKKSISDIGGDVPPPKSDVYQKIIEMLQSISQPDYAQNDSTAPDYIKNRPFYEKIIEGYGPINLTYIYKYPKEEVPVEGLSVFDLEWSEGIKEGDVLAVTVNGQTYSDLIYNGEEALGNELILENPAADGLPFVAFVDIYENSMIAQIAVKGSDYDGSDFSLKKKGIVNKVKQIDEKFIPDTIARTKDVDKKIKEKVEEKMPTNYITTDSDQGELTGVKTWSSGNKTLEFDPFNHINYSSSSDDNNKTDFSFDFNTGEFNLTSNTHYNLTYTHYQSEETLFEQGSFEYHYSYNESNIDIRTADLKANSQEITGSFDRGVGRGIGSFSISYDGFSCSWLHAEATIQNSLDVSSYGISYQFTETTGDMPYSQYSGQLLFPKEGGEGTIATREWVQENGGSGSSSDTKLYLHKFKNELNSNQYIYFISTSNTKPIEDYSSEGGPVYASIDESKLISIYNSGGSKYFAIMHEGLGTYSALYYLSVPYDFGVNNFRIDMNDYTVTEL